LSLLPRAAQPGIPYAETTPSATTGEDPTEPPGWDGAPGRDVVDDLVVYLPDAWPAPRVEQGLEEALVIPGGDVVDREPPIIRSWFRRMRVRFRDNDGPETIRRLGRELDRAIELR
jgi:hypothetical protein